MLNDHLLGIFIGNQQFRKIIQQYKIKFPNDVHVNEVYKQLFDQDLKSNFVILYSLTGRIGFFSIPSIDDGKRIFYESDDTTSDFIKLLVKLINNIGDSFNEELWGGSTPHVLDFWERFNSPCT